MIRLPLVLVAAALILSAADRVKVQSGVLEAPAAQSGVRSFKGIPFAAPPVGDRRWKEPQPPEKWKGVRTAAKFGPRCMQLPLYSDMMFRSDGISEDCLYLNVWTPAQPHSKQRLPVLVYFFGGGYQAGDGSEYRYDGEALAKQGLVTVTVNYRLNVFGFFVHPDLTRESLHHASGNYGLLDQSAALRWVHENIAAFGGDPAKVTIAGESAGSISVSAQMASPLSRDLIAGAIGESGSIIASLAPSPLAEMEGRGQKFAAVLQAASLADLRKLPADQILGATKGQGAIRFGPVLDGYFFPESPRAIYAAGKQAHVPLLAGWNSEEMNARGVLGNAEATAANLEAAIRRLYPGESGEAMVRAYRPASDAAALQAATDLAGDRFIAYGTWKWIEVCSETGGQPVYRYFFARPRPGGKAAGAVHSAEIEYALGNLATNKAYAWTEADYKLSEVMQRAFVNFVKTGNPNGAGVPEWPAVGSSPNKPLLVLDVETRVQDDPNRARYLAMDRLPGAQ